MTENYISPLGLDVVTLEESFALLAPDAEALVERFYEVLFERYPEVKPMFANTSPKKQQTKLLGALKLVVSNVRNPDVLADALTAMGERHQGYGVESEHYTAVATTLIDVMKEFAGDAWNQQIEQAWTHALNTIATVMTDAYAKEDSYVSPLGLDVVTLEDSFALLAPDAEALVERFYEELFLRYPEVKPMFANTSPKKQQTKLLGALKLVVSNVRNPDVLANALTAMGERHQGYGVESEHYTAVATTLIDVMKEFAGDAWNQQIEQAWTHALNTIATVMTDAYITPVRAENTEMSRDDKEELARLKSAVSGAMQAMMMVDRNFIVTYVNEATMVLLHKYEKVFRSVYPGFDPSKIIGVCIDQFHKNPMHQRNMLKDPKNLPFSTTIKVGDLSFLLNVTAMMDCEGEYIGNSLEWSDVTFQLQREEYVARLESAMNGASTNIMICDLDLTITYVNPAVVAMMANRSTQLTKVFPGFDANNLIGQCIDQFHKNPQHQRDLLGNIENLPAKAEIRVAGLDFTVNATAILDQNNLLVGNMVEWCDITEQKDAEPFTCRHGCKKS